MEKAKQAVSSFMSHDGKHKTTVDQDVRAAVTEEHVKPHRHENVTTAIDKEVHQDHHHTTVQPVKHREVLPEQHHHNVIPVEHKSFEHGDERVLQEELNRDAAQYRDKSVTEHTSHSASTAPVIQGERVHHHVHEHVQPVIQKETIAPQVVHTTIPIHETHHAKAVHHGTTTLPTKTLDEFTREHGKVEGHGVSKLSEYEGCPKEYDQGLGGQHAGVHDMHDHHGEHGHSHGAGKTAGIGAVAGAAAMAGNRSHEHNTHNREASDRGLNDRQQTDSLNAARTATSRADDRSMGEKLTGHSAGEGITGNNRTGEGLTGNNRTGEGLTGSGRTGEGVIGSRSVGGQGVGSGVTGNRTTGSSMLDAGTSDKLTGTSRNHDHSLTGKDKQQAHFDGREGNGSSNYTTGGGASGFPTGGSGLNSSSLNKTEPRVGSNTHGSTGTTDDTLEKKPSLVDRLNPFKDADGDGKKGLMS